MAFFEVRVSFNAGLFCIDLMAVVGTKRPEGVIERCVKRGLIRVVVF